jgi:hypothetical protein
LQARELARAGGIEHLLLSKARGAELEVTSNLENCASSRLHCKIELTKCIARLPEAEEFSI